MTDYSLMAQQLGAFAETDPDMLPLLSNASALIMSSMDKLNWSGFYLMRDGRLVLGPFQGQPACIHIEVGKGVCGSAVRDDQTYRVDDVHAFPGHIACDAASASEIVIPIHKNGRIAGVLDIDSPVVSRFTEEDRAGLEQFVNVLESVIVFD